MFYIYKKTSGLPYFSETEMTGMVLMFCSEDRNSSEEFFIKELNSYVNSSHNSQKNRTLQKADNALFLGKFGKGKKIVF